MSAVRGVAASTVSGSTALVNIGGRQVTSQVARGLTLASGDPVLAVRHGSSWYVLARLYASAATPPASDTAPDPQPATRAGALVCSPVSTGTFLAARGSWRSDTDSTYQGTFGGYGLHTGCAFYGVKPTSLDGGTVTGATVQLRRLPGGPSSAAVTLRLVTEATMPGGAPTLTSSTAGPTLAVGESSLAFVVPTAWAQSIVDGTAGGLAVYDADGTPYARLAGVGDWSPAWALTINWTRS